MHDSDIGTATTAAESAAEGVEVDGAIGGLGVVPRQDLLPQKRLPQKGSTLLCQLQDRCNKGLSCAFEHVEGFTPKRQPRHRC